MIAAVANAADDLAFPETFMIRLSSYTVRDAETDIAVFSNVGVGSGFSFADDLGGADSTTIPRLDVYYRFNDKHRIEFAYFKIERGGRKLLKIELDIGDQTYSVGDVVTSRIDYELFKVNYAFSFYRSAAVELSFSAGLNVTTYEFDYQRANGSSASSADANGPLPMLGMRMSYKINPKWSVHYISEAFFIKVSDSFEGAFQNYEFDVEYKVYQDFILGAGLTRFSTDLKADDSEWKGRIGDTHRGLLVYGSYAF